jgi:hypothetical protein
MLFLAVLTALQLLFANAAAAWDDFDFGCANPSLSGLEAVLRYRVFYPTSPSAFDGLRVFETGALRRLEDREAVPHCIAVECIVLQRDRSCTQRQYASIQNKSVPCKTMAKLLVLAACTSALLQQPARRISRRAIKVQAPNAIDAMLYP